MPLAILTSIFWAVQSFAEKRTVGTGIAKRDFFFYCCLLLVPFALIMALLTPFHCQLSPWLIPILIAAVLFRYGKMSAIVVTMTHLVPYEAEAYMCLSLLLAYVVDCLLRIQTFSVTGVLAIAATLCGVFLIADIKLRRKSLQKGLLIRILCDVGLAYCTRFALVYISNALFILLLNMIIVLAFGWCYSMESHRRNLPAIRLVALQQLLGFVVLYLGNLVTQQSVTAYAYIRPIELALCVLLSMLVRNQAFFTAKALPLPPRARQSCETPRRWRSSY